MEYANVDVGCRGRSWFYELLGGLFCWKSVAYKLGERNNRKGETITIECKNK